MWASFILTALAAEYGLKALLVRETGGHRRTHDLATLYRALPAESKSQLMQRHPANDADKAFPEVLELHRHDFEAWRYFDDSHLADLRHTSTDLQLAVCTILDIASPPDEKDITALNRPETSD